MEYEAPIQNTKYGVCTIDAKQDGKIINADKDFVEITGYTLEELKGKDMNYIKLIVEDERSDIFNYLKSKTTKNGMACLEHFMNCKDGSAVAVSCFTKSLGNGYMDVMLTKNITKVSDKDGSGYDSLTGFCNFNAAEAEISRILMSGVEHCHSVLLFKLRHINRMEEVYGRAFAGVVIENAAIYINHQYCGKGQRVVLGRIRHDTFLVFQCAAEPKTVEGIADWICSEMSKCYYGRDARISGGMTAGICHMPAESSFDEALLCAEKALQYSEQYDELYEVYNENKKYSDIKPVYKNVSGYEDKERVLNYDNRFVSFAVAMLASAKDPDSSLDLLIQRIGLQFGLNRVMINIFENSHYARVTNHYEKGKGIIVEQNLVEDMDDRDGFFQRFDSNGCMKIKDTMLESISERERSYYNKYNMRAVVNFLMYDNDKLIGYVSYSASKAKDEWIQNKLNTLMQISRILSLFITIRLHKEENEQRYESLSIDSLTGLSIYAAFLEAAKKKLYEFDPEKVYACIYADIDNFSYINENFGYEEGNEILKDYALRLQKVRSEGSICCHVHADKFIILSIRNSRKEIEKTVQKVNKEFNAMSRAMYPMSDMRVVTGIYYIDDPGCDIVRAVDHAIHVWKHAKKNKYKTYAIYSDDFANERRTRLKIVGSIHNAIESGEIEAFMQPKFSMKTMKVVGAEALSRWRNPDGTYKYPDQFIPFLEDVGYIIDVDFCIFEQVLRAMSEWKANGKKMIPVSVNFSRQHINHDDFVARIMALTAKYGVEPKYIEIEITESAFMKKPEKMMRFMRELREEGYKIDIDDFGTGYSSLNMLLDVPVDIVKIDKSFIDDYDTQLKREYINQIGNLIQTAKKDIIFEGVETQEQIKFLTDCGYENAQGYVFSKPISMKNFEEKYIYNI